MEISIIAIGDELLIGQVIDTNSGWIARHIQPYGWSVKSVRVIADDRGAIEEAVNEALKETDVVLTTGGLGPTKDDITKDALCGYFGGELIYDKEVEANVNEVVEKRHLKINPLTAAQAYVPSSCRVIQNKVGTAPIMWFEKDGKVLVSMPGVPFETEIMMAREVIPQLLAHFNADDHIEYRTFIVINYSESVLAMKLEEFEREIPDYIKLAYLPKPGVIRLRLSGMSQDGDRLKRDMNRLSVQLHNIIGVDIICDDDKSLAEIMGDILRERNISVGTAESCTGGNIAHQITAIPGSSDYFNGSIVSYSNSVKKSILGVSQNILDSVGAVSEETVKQMCVGAIKELGVDCAISTSGIAGPGGGSNEKPVGTVWIATMIGENCIAEKYHFAGDRTRVIDRATTAALIQMIKQLKQR